MIFTLQSDEGVCRLTNMKFSSVSHRVRKGFTLIELMVVVAIDADMVDVPRP